MAKSEHLNRLFRALSNEDISTAKAVAETICAEEDKKGHRQLSRRLKSALDPNGRVNGAHNGAVSPKAASVMAALSRIEPEVEFDELRLKPAKRKTLESVIKEWRHRSVLSSKNLKPRNRLFFYGPPGCGKSATAAAIGKELSLPTFLIRFDAIIGSYLGQTAGQLRQLFNFAEHTAAVLVFDEMDALGKKRGNPLDVGELDRIVISLMQELEHTHPLGLIIATSNLPKHIDDALWRRFDLSLEFSKPTKSEIVQYGRTLCKELEIPFGASLKKHLESSDNYADGRNLVMTEARHLALKDV